VDDERPACSGLFVFDVWWRALRKRSAPFLIWHLYFGQRKTAAVACGGLYEKRPTKPGDLFN
jgi:hypothetical protein